MSASSSLDLSDPINARILALTEDRLPGFQRNPIGEIGRLTGVPQDVVTERLRALLEGGVIRRIQQNLVASAVADGVFCAWLVPAELLAAAFDFLHEKDPFTSQVIIRSAAAETPGADYNLWSTLKVPAGFSLTEHVAWLADQIHAEAHRLMPAKKLFILGAGHVRRRSTEPGSRATAPAESVDVAVVKLNELEWQVLTAVKRDFNADELGTNLWQGRANEAGVSLSRFFQVAETLHHRGIIGRFSTTVERVKAAVPGEKTTKFNALFHWAVPRGREVEAGREIGRHHIITQAFWREGGYAFEDVNVMGIAHGTDQEALLAHKAAIDQHLEEAGLRVSHTNVFWGGRSEGKTGEISPIAYAAWCTAMGIDVATMRDPTSDVAALSA